ncbi:MAG TPA: carboxypeptidase-like regulatory domain-containing protein [Phnomibacter sp.]|nr:carboxypeptidase-like regulatory domain-containing protein [Phnomibacter sp.]
MYKLIALVLAVFLSSYVFTQPSTPLEVQQLATSGRYKACYRVPVDSSLRWLQKDSINFKYLNTLKPLLVLPMKADIDSLMLPPGQYIWISAHHEMLQADWQQVNYLSCEVLTNNRQYGLEVFDKNGQQVNNANVLFRKKQLTFDSKTGTYLLPTKKIKEDWIVVSYGRDTLIRNLEEDDRYSYYYKRNKRWKHWPVIRQVRNAPKWVAGFFNGDNWYRRDNKKKKRQKELGFMVFNKPTYKPGDTVRLKAWITNRKEQPITKPQEVWISYQNRGKLQNRKLATVSPVSPGAYVYEIPIADSFPSDTRYSVEFKGKKEYASFYGSFMVEEYVLPDISKFEFKSLQEDVLAKDSLHFTVEASDANGLPLLDGRIMLTIKAGDVKKFYQDTLFVADTLFAKEYALSGEGKMPIDISAAIFPKADISLNIKAELVNSSNEVQEKNEQVDLWQHRKIVKFNRTEGLVNIEYTEDDSSLSKKALISTLHENDNDNEWRIDTLVQLPFTMRVHPLATVIEVDVLDELGKTLEWDSYELIEERDRPVIISDSYSDSIGFKISNPKKLQLHFTVLRDNKIVWQTHNNEEAFSWHTEAKDRQLYRVQMLYSWIGRPQTDVRNLVVHNKLLQVKAVQQPAVQPGTKDTMQVEVTDYKNRPAANVNLTAVAQNAQLKDKFNFPNLPLNFQYRNRYTKTMKPVEWTELALSGTTAAFPYENTRQSLGLDTMQYYKWLFFTDSLEVHRTLFKYFFPELSVHAISAGKPEPLYIVYLNRNAIWFDGINSTQAYSNRSYPGYAQVGIRLKNKYIEIDSIYLQPYYKHDIFINVDSIGNSSHTKLTKMPDSLQAYEKDNLQKHFARFENTPMHRYTSLLSAGGLSELYGSNSSDWIAGPFEAFDSIYAWKRNELNYKFPFEPGYRYRLSQHNTRLEKMQLLPWKYWLNEIHAIWRLGETIPDTEFPPPPVYIAPPFLETTWQQYSSAKAEGTLQLQLLKDSIYSYTVLLPYEIANRVRVISGAPNKIHGIIPGMYMLIMVTKNRLFQEIRGINIQKGGITCVQLKPGKYVATNATIDSLRTVDLRSKPSLPVELPTQAPQNEPAPVRAGTANIEGYVTDMATGKPIPGATVMIKNSKTGSSTDTAGMYRIKGVAPGSYTLIFNMIGYSSKELKVQVYNFIARSFDVQLKMDISSLDEVVVVGYGVSREKKSFTGSVAYVTVANQVTQELQGRVAGVSVTNGDGAFFIRGAGSVTVDDAPLYVVDGVVMDAMPAIDPSSIVSTDVLKSSAATAIYGSRAANGVVIITTGRNNGPVIRTVFRDYAYWQPNTITDKNGKASIPIEYPDNITSWQHAVYAAAPKGKYGRAMAVTKVFKALQGLLTVPQFLLEGDIVHLIGKAMNYADRAKTINTVFKANGIVKNESASVKSNDFVSRTMGIKAPASPDTVRASFMVQDESNNKDGEERTVPVFAIGSQETKGKFYVLNADSSFNFQPLVQGQPVKLYADNKLIDVLEKELESLIQYPQACMEQTGNKLWGLVMMKKIKQATHQPFKYEKKMQPLLDRLLKYQQFDGGWAWWQQGTSNVFITGKVLQSLQQLDSTPTIHQAIRNGYLFLQNGLPKYSVAEKLEAMVILSEGRHVYPYALAVDSLKFDSLSLHQQWQLVRIKQKAGLDYQKELDTLWKKRTEEMLGHLYWGKDSWYWQNNRNATTTLAFKVYNDRTDGKNTALRIKQYFLEQRKSGYYRNTVEKATISAMLLEDALKENQSTAPAVLTINGQSIKEFPAALSLAANDRYAIQKIGNGLLYLGLYQQQFNRQPHKVDSLFKIDTRFVQRGDTLSATAQLKAGAKASLEVDIEVKKSAEYVQIEMPIPAACWYASKPNSWYEHREYLKDRVIIFVEEMPIGKYHYTIPLEVRFTGKFSINPAKAELMYFPMFYGREQMKAISVE